MNQAQLEKLKQETLAEKLPEVKLETETAVNYVIYDMQFTPKAQETAKNEGRKCSLVKDSFMVNLALVRYLPKEANAKWVDLLQYKGVDVAKILIEDAPIFTNFMFNTTFKNGVYNQWNLKFDKYPRVETEKQIIAQLATWFETHWNVPFALGLTMLTNLQSNIAGSLELNWSDIFGENDIPDEKEIAIIGMMFRYWYKKEGDKYPTVYYDILKESEKTVLPIADFGAKVLPNAEKLAIATTASNVIAQRKANKKVEVGTAAASSTSSQNLAADLPF